MIEFFKSNFSIGDPLEITTDTESIRGKIDFIGPDYVVLRLSNNQVKGISESTIRTFSSISEEQATTSAPMTAPAEAAEQPKPMVDTPQTKAFKKYKPGERVPLSVLTERDPSLLHDWHKRDETRKKSTIAIEGIRKAYDEAKAADRTEDTKVPEANGKIVQLKPSYQFGFIDSPDNNRYFFNRADLIDSTLRDFTGENIEVAFLPASNHKGLTAKAVVRPRPIREMLDIVMERAADGEIFRAKALLRMLAQRYPGNKSIDAILSALVEALGQEGSGDDDEETADYSQGNKYLAEKDFEKALESFKSSIEAGKKTEQSIKQIISTYVRMYTGTEDLAERDAIRQTALDFIHEKRSDLPENINTLFVLENAYFALGEYASHIEIVEEVINFCAKRRDIAKYLFYLKKAAQSYYRLGEFTRALDTAQEGLERDPEDEQLLKLRDMAQDELNIRLQQQ
jgi:hypothetical protein